MSRFFQAASDSESSSSDEELYGSSSENESGQEEESSEDEDDEDESESDESDDEGDGANAFLKNKFLKGGDGSDSESESEDEGRRVVKSAKDKLLDEIDANIKVLENGKKINDFVSITAEFDKLIRNVERANKQYQTVPQQFIKLLSSLDEFITEFTKSDAKKKLNTSNNRAYNTVKQRVRKQVKEYEDKVKLYQTDPEAFEQQATPKPSVPPTPKAKGSPAPVAGGEAAEAEDDDDGFATVGKGGKTLQHSPATVFKTLISIIESRGKKNTDRAEQAKTLESLLQVANTPYQKISILMMLVPIRFDLTASGNVMATNNWKKAESDIQQLFDVLEASTDTYRVSESASEPEDLEQGPQPDANGIRQIPGSIVSLLERLDDELTRALQIIDPHTTEYVDRLRDEADLYNLMLRAQIYLENNKTSSKDVVNSDALQPLSRLLVRRLDHIYYKPTDVIITTEKNAWAKIPQSTSSAVTPRVTEEQEGGSAYTIELINNICSILYQQPNTVFRTKAMLSHIYHYALNDHYFQARDMFLMSHLQSSIHSAEPAVQVLFNRALVQVGLCAFRTGLINEAQSSLQEICSSSKLKELLGQGAKYQTTDKQRLLPFHMHINLELLECVYLTASLLIEIPTMASLGSGTDAKKKVISKPFRRMLDYHDRQVFTGPPENTRDHIMQAAKALLNGDWTTARDLLTAIKIWNLMANSSEIKSMLTAKLQQEGLRTYLFSYGSFYQSLSLATLSNLFDLSERKVAAVVSKMIANEDIAAALDQKTHSVVFRQGVELSKLQVLAQSLADKAVQLTERNERLAAGGLLDTQPTNSQQSSQQQQQQSRSSNSSNQQKKGNQQQTKQARTVRA